MAARSRYVVMGVLAIAGVVGLVMAHSLNWAASTMEVPNPALFGVRDFPAASVLGFVLAALGAGAVLLRPAPRTWANEVVDELWRVSWPSREETVHATLVVMVCVVVCAAFLGVFDAAWLWLSGVLMGAQTTTG